MKYLNNDKDEIYILLKRKVEATLGRQVTSYRDCIQLTEEIYTKTSFKISQNTLRRFFNLVKAVYPPSSVTLDILSKYSGFDSLEELLHLKSKDCLSEATGEGKFILSYLISLFKFVNIKHGNDETYLAVVKQVIFVLQKHPELVKKFQREIAKTKNGQEFYFEQFVNIDQLNFDYGDGLRYYLNEKKTTEGQIFGHSLLLLRAWLINDDQGLKKQFKEIAKKRLSKGIHPFNHGLYFASHLFHAKALGLNTEKILLNARHAHLTLKSFNDNCCLFPTFEYVISIALVFTHHYEQALYYLDYAEKNYYANDSYIDEGFYETRNLILGMALMKTGNKKKAEAIYERIKPSQFYFLNKKTSTILYLLLAGYLGKRSEKGNKQFQTLIKETGYFKFLSYK